MEKGMAANEGACCTDVLLKATVTRGFPPSSSFGTQTTGHGGFKRSSFVLADFGPYMRPWATENVQNRIPNT